MIGAPAPNTIVEDKPIFERSGKLFTARDARFHFSFAKTTLHGSHA